MTTNVSLMSKLPVFGHAARLLAEAHHRSEAQAKARHERFNIFTTLLKADDEVKLHTRFLHALLDPNGLHDCGDLFLRLFFETLSIVPCKDHNDTYWEWQAPTTEEDWKIKKEMGQTGGLGQIDILLTHPTFAIAIENKINAGESENQLSDYALFLSHYRKGWRLLYLTKDGRKSVTHGEHPYLRVSYIDHILPWLEACLRETYSTVPVNQILLQYREVVRQITNKTLENPFMKPVIDYVSNNLDILRFWSEMDEALKEVVASFLDRLADAVVKDLSRDHQVELGKNGRFGLAQNGEIFIQAFSSSNLYGVPFQICLEMDRGGKILVIGIYADDNDHSLDSLDYARLAIMNECLTEHSRNTGYHKEEVQGSWPLGWHNILEDLDHRGFAKLLSEDFETLVIKICDDARHYIKQLEAAYDMAKSKVS